MLLRNYDNLMASKQIARIDSFSMSEPKLQLTYSNGAFKDNLYHSYYASPFENFKNNQNQKDTKSTLATGYSNLVIGYTDTPVIYTDDEMKGIFSTTQVTNVSHAIDYSIDENNILTTSYKKFFCANEDLTINEIGIYFSYVKDSGNTAQPRLMYRDVLETPVQAPMGANVCITFTRKIPLYSNAPIDYVATASVE